MNDQNIPAGLTREGARAVREWALHALNKPGASTTTEKAAARVILNTVPEPRPTLADMTEEERDACQWMQCEVNGEIRVITLIRESNDHAVTLAPSGFTFHCPPEKVTPRPDLPRMEWPADQKAAVAPALPGGWRFADHQEYGRVIVTNPTPNRDCYVYIVLPVDDPMGYDWHFCDPDDLTYIDADQ